MIHLQLPIHKKYFSTYAILKRSFVISTEYFDITSLSIKNILNYITLFIFFRKKTNYNKSKNTILKT